MGTSITRAYESSADRLFDAVLRAVAALDYSVTLADRTSWTVSFWRGTTLRHWGLSMAVMISPEGASESRLTLIDSHHFVLMGSHELASMHRQFLERLDSILPSITEPAPLDASVSIQPRESPPARLSGSGEQPNGSVIASDGMPPVLTRTYHGKPNEVEAQRATDAEVLARSWYFPTSQSYVEGRWSAGAWVLAFLAMVLLIGIFILAYMIAAKPAGTLTVIYERRLPSAPAAPASPPPPEVIEALAAVPGGPGRPLEGPAGIEARLATLKRLRASGAISEDEYQARRNKILDEV